MNRLDGQKLLISWIGDVEYEEMMEGKYRRCEKEEGRGAVRREWVYASDANIYFPLTGLIGHCGGNDLYRVQHMANGNWPKLTSEPNWSVYRGKQTYICS